MTNEEWAAIERPYRRVIMEHTRMLTTKQVAAVLGIAARTVKDYCRTGRLKATKYGRDWLINERDLDEYRQSPKSLGRPRKSTH
jgi:excisionase family DNA binding protein